MGLVQPARIPAFDDGIGRSGGARRRDMMGGTVRCRQRGRLVVISTTPLTPRAP